jgi:homopolymeric O-antigen transport system ATP-binding protein
MTAIEARNLTKIYKIYGSPVDRLKEIIHRRPYHSEFTALDNIDFSVPKGETFGVIGENGAGKSTLLKILAKTLKPSSGHLAINGRSAALLELGAGFNPEFTGEENIYLNAYLLGLSKSDIEKNKARIIDFSELGDFIKRPVKTYSSGMNVRLAFSIATCVNPEILIIDEALSVGDQHFQKKCIDRMMHLREDGKTILFCSHSLYLVQELCNRSIWLKNGGMEMIGKTAGVINAYNDWMREKDAGMNVAMPETRTVRVSEREKEKPMWVEDIRITNQAGSEYSVVKTGQEIQLVFRVRVKQAGSAYRGHIAVALHRNDEETVFGSTTKMDSLRAVSFYDGMTMSLKFPSLPLLSGQYFFTVLAIDEHALHPYDIVRSKLFSVESPGGELGIVKLDHIWETRAAQETDTVR